MAGILSSWPKRGEIYWVDFDADTNKGSEQQKRRPALIISADDLNRNLNVVTVAAISSKIKSTRNDSVLLLEEDKPLPKESAVLLFQVRTIDKVRLATFAGKLDPEQIRNLKSKLRNVWDI